MPARSLHLSDIVKSYIAGQRAVDGIHLDIASGEFVTFLGPSGSGKTTTLMMIAGFEKPDTGHIALDGRNIEDVPPYARNIGMVFQNYALFPHMSVLDNVCFPLQMRGKPRRDNEKAAQRMLEIVGLAGFSGRRPNELSGGQQQRVALARALVFEPDLVLLDEPLGALDKALREHMQVELKRIHRELGVTMIYVTHDQTEAMTMSDRIAVFNHGKIEQIGTPQDVYFTPRTRFVASFVGDSNLLRGIACDNGTEIDVPDIGRIALSRQKLERGQAYEVLIRPEVFHLLANSDLKGGPAPTLAIKSVVNFGDSILLIGAVGQAEIRVRVPSITAGHLKAGQDVPITWSAEHVHVVGA